MRERIPLSPAQLVFATVPPLVTMLAVLMQAPLKVAVAAGGSLYFFGGVWLAVTLTRRLRARDALTHFRPPDLVDAGATAERSLRATDPGFSRERFVERVQLLAQRFGEATELAALHPLVSDGLFQRLSTQERLGHRPRAPFADRGTTVALIAGHAVTVAYDELTVRLTLHAGAQEQTFHLVFLRRRGARTAEGDVTRGSCPNCGAPLTLTATQRCAHCEAIVNSGTFDWVLCELSPGVHHLRRRQGALDPHGCFRDDAHLAAEELEDRAALAFWRWAEARCTGEGRRLGRVATAAFLSAGDEPSRLEGPLQVGKVELRLLERHDTHARALVVVDWVQGEAEKVSHQSALELVRPAGRVSNGAVGLSSLRCQACLAASTDAEEPVCSYCGAPFGDDWCLAALQPFADVTARLSQARQALGGDWSRATTPAQREHAFRLLVSLGRADGSLSAHEQAFLERVATRWSLEASVVQQSLKTTTERAPTGLPRLLRTSLTLELVELAFVDGALEPRTRKQLEAVAQALGTELDLSSALARKK